MDLVLAVARPSTWSSTSYSKQCQAWLGSADSVAILLAIRCATQANPSQPPATHYVFHYHLIISIILCEAADIGFPQSVAMGGWTDAMSWHRY